MKKNILIIMPSMFIGGAERSLIGLLESIDYSKNNVDLFLYRQEGEFLKFIPKKVNLLSQINEYTNFDRPIKDVLFSKNFKFGIKRLKSKIIIKRRGNENVWSSLQYIYHNMIHLLPNFNKEYDLGINFLNPAEILVEKVKAKKKMAWVHTDYTKLIPDKHLDLYTYSNVDYIVNVSKDCEDKFLNTYPMLKGKSLVIENILSKEFIIEQSNYTIRDDNFKSNSGKIKLLSIGRLTEQKNFDNVPSICKSILESGLNIEWYIIGYGPDENYIKEKIKEAKVEKHVIILGKKENPYPYIKACDIYIQPSRYEGYCTTTNEARMLSKPVITTDVSGSREQFVDGETGWIVPIEENAIYERIKWCIENPQAMKEVSERLGKINIASDNKIAMIFK